jgi:hypothetical protein
MADEEQADSLVAWLTPVSSDYHSAFGTRIVLEAEGAARSTVEILAQHGISVDRSADLLPG